MLFDRERGEADRDDRDLVDLEEPERDLVDLEAPERDLLLLVSPASRRCLFTMRDATSFSRPLYSPSFFILRTISLYSRSRLGLLPLGIFAPFGMLYACMEFSAP